MFHHIPQPILARMRELEDADKRDRANGTPRLQRLRQIPAEVGSFLGIVAANTPPGAWLEIGTSAGYSTLWLAMAARATGRKTTSYEVLPEKADLARQTFTTAAVEDVVEFVQGDARIHLPACKEVAFCFLDAEKEIYQECYELVVPLMVPGGVLIADNAISHEADLRPMLKRAMSDTRVDAVIVPIGKGELVCRRV